jgi:hypothetical protein
VERNSEPAAATSFLQGGAALIVAAALVLILLVWLPAYRWFFLGSLGIGVIVAAILYFWNQYRPVKGRRYPKQAPSGPGMIWQRRFRNGACSRICLIPSAFYRVRACNFSGEAAN